MRFAGIGVVWSAARFGATLRAGYGDQEDEVRYASSDEAHAEFASWVAHVRQR